MGLIDPIPPNAIAACLIPCRRKSQYRQIYDPGLSGNLKFWQFRRKLSTYCFRWFGKIRDSKLHQVVNSGGPEIEISQPR